MPTFTPISHEAFVADVRALAAAIAADAAWQPTFLIGIGRGGLAPAVYLSHASGLPALSCDFSGAIKDFAEEVLARLAARTRPGPNGGGERLLFIDDINDSGRTIAGLRAALAEAGAAEGAVRVATLIDNRMSAERVDYAARVIDRTTTKDWYVFPWEAMAPAGAIEQDAAEVPERIA